MRRLFTAAAAVAICLGSSTASAQTSAWGENGFVGINGIFQSESQVFQAVTRPQINLEPAEVTTVHGVRSTPMIDVMGGGRIVGNLGFGFGFTWLRTKDTANVSARVPHPFYYDQSRTISGEADDLPHDERVFHANAMWLLPFSDAVQLSVYGGPSYFTVEQTTVRTVSFTDFYPFDEAELTGVERSKQKASKVGFNVGTDLTVFFSERFGIGGVARFSRADVVLPSPDGSGENAIEAGGLYLGGGLRVRF